ncbi:MAG TPA: NAD(P)-dependent alcohol dehydrogenase [Polyangiaceae bacterium]|nr:NAD(P)-dependent alcohol dehydrogenase [Polyangiaceae bacterium]
MKSIVMGYPGRGVEAWKLQERDVPKPGPGQVLVRIRAASVNFRDLRIAQGAYGGPAKQGLVVLSDGAGEIAALGPGVTRYAVGDRVASTYYPTWNAGPYRAEVEDVGLGIGDQDGVLAEYALLSAHGIVRIPDTLGFEQAAALPCAAVTAWQALFEGSSRLLPGSSVVVQGTGGVSLFAAQLARATGHRVIATSSSAAKLERLGGLGITDRINYRETPQWHEQVLHLTGGQGADLVIDVGGGATLASSLAATRGGGRIAVVGLLGGAGPTIDPLPILFRTVTVEGVHVGSLAMFESLLRAVERSKLQPVIDRVFELPDAAQALAALAAGEHFGKLVIRVP